MEFSWLVYVQFPGIQEKKLQGGCLEVFDLFFQTVFVNLSHEFLPRFLTIFLVQFFDQIFGQGFDQGFGKEKKTMSIEYSVQ